MKNFCIVLLSCFALQGCQVMSSPPPIVYHDLGSLPAPTSIAAKTRKVVHLQVSTQLDHAATAITTRDMSQPSIVSTLSAQRWSDAIGVLVLRQIDNYATRDGLFVPHLAGDIGTADKYISVKITTSEIQLNGSQYVGRVVFLVSDQDRPQGTREIECSNAASQLDVTTLIESLNECVVKTTLWLGT
ncbi:MAG: hypothetical protein RJQ07_01580 [Pseudomonadales bacterium]